MNEQFSLYSRGDQPQEYFLKYKINYQESDYYVIKELISHVNSDFQFKFDYQGQSWAGIAHDLKDDQNHLYQLDMNADSSRAFIAQLMDQNSVQLQTFFKKPKENSGSQGLLGDLISSAVKKNKMIEGGNIKISWPNFNQDAKHFQDCITNKGPAPGWVQRIDPEEQQRQQEQKDKATQDAYNNAMDVGSFLAYGSDVVGKRVTVKGSIYCRNLDSCNIIDGADSYKKVWFNPRGLDVQSRQRIMQCNPYNETDLSSICSVIMSGNARNVSVVQNGEQTVQPGINATSIKFLSIGDITNMSFGKIINQFGGR
ncbi:hypothetical protein BGC30_10200 [Novacetimonas hansenii]|nr:hypothetical protein BGC30_10200 [Novacetimonas hansenii]